MTTHLPDPHGCPHCGHAGIAERWGETICGMCHAPRVHATPGCPVRNAVLSRLTDETLPIRDIDLPDPLDWPTLMRESTTAETARERRVHDGGPRVLEFDPDTGETREVR